MAIRLTCQQCGKTVKAPDAAAGKRGKCPYCGQKITIPALGQTPADAPPPPPGQPAVPAEPPMPGQPAAAPPPPPPPAAPQTPPPAENDSGYGLAPSDEQTEDLKQRLIEQALGMEDDLDDDPAPAAPTPPPAADAEPAAPPPLPAEPVPAETPSAAAPPIDAMSLPMVDEPRDGDAAPAAGAAKMKFSHEQVAAMSPMDCIHAFLQLMSESQLEDAGRFVGKMKKAQRQEIEPVVKDLDPATLTHPALKDIPPPVLKSFIIRMQRELR